MTEPHSPSPLASKSFKITSSRQPTCDPGQTVRHTPKWRNIAHAHLAEVL